MHIPDKIVQKLLDRFCQWDCVNDFKLGLDCKESPEPVKCRACWIKALELNPVDELESDVEDECSLCGGDLILRRSKYGEFLGCENYPKCKGRRKK